MISKHIPMRNVKKSSFSELAKYIENPQNKLERVGALRVTNCQQQSIVDAAKYEIEPTQRLNQRTVQDKTYHFVISFRAGENPPKEVLEAIEDRMCAALGFAEHQRVSAVHHDTDNIHIHVAVNKIHPVTHNIHTPYNDYKTRSSMCQLLEKEYGLERDNHKAEKTLSENRAADMERHSGIESFLGWIKRECATQIRQAQTWPELHQTLRENGLELRQKGNGFVITGPDGLGVKASSVDRSFSRSSLEKKLGVYSDSQTQPPAKRASADVTRAYGEHAPRVIRPGAKPPQHVTARGFDASAIPVVQKLRPKRYEARPLVLRPETHQPGQLSREVTQKVFEGEARETRASSQPTEHILQPGQLSREVIQKVFEGEARETRASSQTTDHILQPGQLSREVIQKVFEGDARDIRASSQPTEHILQPGQLSREVIQKVFEGVPKVIKPGSRPPEHVLQRKGAESSIPRPEYRQQNASHVRGQASVNTAELYARYRQEQQSLTALRNEALRLARSRRERAVENAKRTGRLRRAAIKLLKGEGVNKRYLYGLASKALQDATAKASEAYKKDKEAAYELHKRRTWADWLQHKAGQGNDDALQALRKKSAQEARKAADGLYGEKVRRDGRIPGLKPDSVTKEGTIIYRVGESAIRDAGRKLDVSRDAGDDGLHAALLMARHRYGSTLRVNGSIEFKKRIAAVAAARKLDVTFSDPVLERMRQALSGVADRKREYFHVPAAKRAEARKAGAMWDNVRKSWYAGPYASSDQIDKFIKANEVMNHERREQRETSQPRGQRRAPAAADARGAGHDNRGQPDYRDDQRGRRLRSSDGPVAGGRPERGDSGRKFPLSGRGRSGLSGGAKPHFTKLARNPPTQGENRVRRVPEFNVVSHGQRGEMLLQSEIRVHVDQQGAGSPDPVRRGIHRAGIDSAPKTEVRTGPSEKYISEREEKRLKGFDIPKHRGYNSQDNGQFEYAGQRKVDGETLALIRREKDIIVMPVNEYTARRLSSLKVGDSVTLTRSGAVRTSKGRKR